MAAIGVSHTSTLTSDSSRARSSVSSIFAIVDRKSMIDPSDDAGVNLEPLRGDIEFRHVRFRYPTRPDIQIFEDLCLTIQSGKVPTSTHPRVNLSQLTFYKFAKLNLTNYLHREPVSQTVALVGESGSGKSTAISLLQRFYDPDAGHILLDGVDIQKFQVRWLRQQMGLVSQEPALFNDTIRANIAYGKEGEATESDIISAAQLANAHKFISSLHQVRTHSFIQ